MGREDLSGYQLKNGLYVDPNESDEDADSHVGSFHHDGGGSIPPRKMSRSMSSPNIGPKSAVPPTIAHPIPPLKLDDHSITDASSATSTTLGTLKTLPTSPMNTLPDAIMAAFGKFSPSMVPLSPTTERKTSNPVCIGDPNGAYVRLNLRREFRVCDCCFLKIREFQSQTGTTQCSWNGLSPMSEASFLAKFAFPASQAPVVVVSCCYFPECVPYYGHMYLTREHVCFYAYKATLEPICISYEDVTAVVKPDDIWLYLIGKMTKILDTELQSDVQHLYETLFHTHEFYHRVMDPMSHFRKVESKHPPKVTFPGLPPYAECTRYQLCRHDENTIGGTWTRFVLAETLRMKKIPYADYFEIETRWVFTLDGNKFCHAEVCWRFDFQCTFGIGC
ncbi:hypothetical protein DYB34_010840 [Aphanomyces astaci]|uniref:VASt domain-containing protein n=1 Tax=Aphanomyces astaci TaxID=112090 RepID=A0A397ACN6_APHAT|nr:hypothetical protein DYB36_007968 [Aphanomyces astaci]RHY66452.1 hypothetical protein DYB34_010840 [Aphanomyces astaci]